MPLYRFSLENEEDRSEAAREQRCGDDDEALRFARTLLTEFEIVQVWERERFVGRVARWHAPTIEKK